MNQQKTAARAKPDTRTVKYSTQEPTFAALAVWALDEWGLRLSSAVGNMSTDSNRTYRTGFILSGSFPGDGYQVRWFRTLRDVARVTKFKVSAPQKPPVQP